jgi:inner membrane transporter RhtA
MNLIFYLAIERIPIGLAVTLEFIGPLVVAVLGSDYTTYGFSLAAAGIILIAPWSNNGIDLLCCICTLAGALWQLTLC